MSSLRSVSSAELSTFSALAALDDQDSWRPGTPAASLQPVRTNPAFMEKLRETISLHGPQATLIAQNVVAREAPRYFNSSWNDTPKLSHLLWTAWAQGDLTPPQYVTAMGIVDLQQQWGHHAAFTWATCPEEDPVALRSISDSLSKHEFNITPTRLKDALESARREGHSPDLLHLEISDTDEWARHAFRTPPASTGLDPITKQPRYFLTAEFQDVLNGLIAKDCKTTPAKWAPYWGRPDNTTHARLRAQGFYPISTDDESIRSASPSSMRLSGLTDDVRAFACDHFVAALQETRKTHAESQSICHWLDALTSDAVRLAWPENSDCAAHDLAERTLQAIQRWPDDPVSYETDFQALDDIIRHLNKQADRGLAEAFGREAKRLMDIENKHPPCDSLVNGLGLDPSDDQDGTCTIL